MDTFERFPVLEPDQLSTIDTVLTAESSLHEVFNDIVMVLRQKSGFGIVLEHELRPDDQVSDVWVNAIRPVIVQNPVVSWVGEHGF